MLVWSVPFLPLSSAVVFVSRSPLLLSPIVLQFLLLLRESLCDKDGDGWADDAWCSLSRIRFRSRLRSSMLPLIPLQTPSTVRYGTARQSLQQTLRKQCTFRRPVRRPVWCLVWCSLLVLPFGVTPRFPFPPFAVSSRAPFGGPVCRYPFRWLLWRVDAPVLGGARDVGDLLQRVGERPSVLEAAGVFVVPDLAGFRVLVLVPYRGAS
uniref:Transmembrane protein n=1 Tax=Pseudo-nitzschia australis TaxID=44445 RepID=A0A7S4AJ63_9STRA